MRILATLILVATIAPVIPVQAAGTQADTDQNSKQILETKNTSSLNDNFVVAIYIPATGSRKPVSRTLATNLVLPRGSFVVNTSAYTAAADECGKSDGITASGVKVQANRTLACPRQYKFGTKIEIEGMGTYVCEDRGGAIKGNHFDIYMPTKKEAFAFGRRNLVANVVE